VQHRAASFSLLAPFSLLALGVLLVSGCGASTTNAAAGGVTPKNVLAEGLVLRTACVATGPELCFNALDDNCNGIIDEGCGLSSGVLQFSVAWGDSPADLDLIVTDPAGNKVSSANKSSSTGLILDRDCPDASNCRGQNVENIYLEGLDPPRGKYTVEVRLRDLRRAQSPVAATLGARLGSRTFGAELSLSPTQGTDRVQFSFEL